MSCSLDQSSRNTIPKKDLTETGGGTGGFKLKGEVFVNNVKKTDSQFFWGP